MWFWTILESYKIENGVLFPIYWTQPGETLSHNNACKEYGLEKNEIFEAIKLGKLQYKENYAHGNPYYKLLREEVKALAVELRGCQFFEKQEIEFQLKTVKKEINSCKRKLKSKEREKLILIEKLDQFEK